MCSQVWGPLFSRKTAPGSPPGRVLSGQLVQRLGPQQPGHTCLSGGQVGEANDEESGGDTGATRGARIPCKVPPEAAQLQTSVAMCGMLAQGCQSLWLFSGNLEFWGKPPNL